LSFAGDLDLIGPSNSGTFASCARRFYQLLDPHEIARHIASP